MVVQRLSQLNPKVIFDVGANVGDYSSYAARQCPAAKVYSFEPVHQQLVKTLNENRINNVVVVQKVLSNFIGKIKINTFQHSAHSTVHELKGIDNERLGVEEIESTTGDEFMASSSIDSVDFLKLDVEGSEMDALKGFEKALKDKRVKIIQFEYGTLT